MTESFYATQEQADRFTSGWEEEFWARRNGFMNASDYWTATNEAFDSEQAAREQWESSE